MFFHEDIGSKTDVVGEINEIGALLKMIAGYGVHGPQALLKNVEYTGTLTKRKKGCEVEEDVRLAKKSITLAGDGIGGELEWLVGAETSFVVRCGIKK